MRQRVIVGGALARCTGHGATHVLRCTTPQDGPHYDDPMKLLLYIGFNHILQSTAISAPAQASSSHPSVLRLFLFSTHQAYARLLLCKYFKTE